MMGKLLAATLLLYLNDVAGYRLLQKERLGKPIFGNLTTPNNGMHSTERRKRVATVAAWLSLNDLQRERLGLPTSGNLTTPNNGMHSTENETTVYIVDESGDSSFKLIGVFYVADKLQTNLLHRGEDYHRDLFDVLDPFSNELRFEFRRKRAESIGRLIIETENISSVILTEDIQQALDVVNLNFKLSKAVYGSYHLTFSDQPGVAGALERERLGRSISSNLTTPMVEQGHDSTEDETTVYIVDESDDWSFKLIGVFYAENKLQNNLLQYGEDYHRDLFKVLDPFSNELIFELRSERTDPIGRLVSETVNISSVILTGETQQAWDLNFKLSEAVYGTYHLTFSDQPGVAGALERERLGRSISSNLTTPTVKQKRNSAQDEKTVYIVDKSDDSSFKLIGVFYAENKLQNNLLHHGDDEHRDLFKVLDPFSNELRFELRSEISESIGRLVIETVNISSVILTGETQQAWDLNFELSQAVNGYYHLTFSDIAPGLNANFSIW